MIVGLGNPGRQYHMTRHNAGALVLDALLARGDRKASLSKFQGRLEEHVFVQGEVEKKVVLVRPDTFMNLSGTTVAPAVREYNIAPGHLLVLHDEIELAFGEIRMKKGGGHKGHNGLRDIIAKAGSPDFERLRFGVGRPDHPDVADYVLSPFAKEEQAELPGLCARAADLAVGWVFSL